MSQQHLTLAAGTTAVPLPAAGALAAGTYLVRVQQGSQQQILRLVRQ